MYRVLLDKQDCIQYNVSNTNKKANYIKFK